MVHHLAIAPLFSGIAMLMLGLVPGLIDNLMEGILEFGSMLTMSPVSSRPPAPTTETHRLWFTLIGLALIILGTAASFIN